MHLKPIESIMSGVSTTVGPGALLQEVIDLMAEREHSCVVVEEDGLPLGVLTERNVVRLASENSTGMSDLVVGDVMTSPPVTVLPSLPLYEGLHLSRARKLRHLLVVDEQRKLIGIVTQSDMVHAYLKQIDSYRQALESAVKSRTEELESSNRELLDLVMEDSLTKIGNRRAMEVDLAFTQTSAKRYGEKYHVALLDIDFFKKYNDCYGHQAGDEALVKVAQLIKNALRGSDRLYRYGGEEFLLLIPKVSLAQAKSIVERAKINVLEAKIKHEKSNFSVLTVSGGVAIGDDENWEESLKEADKALYEAKGRGRNIVVASTVTTPTVTTST